jgi:hypothetical protein
LRARVDRLEKALAKSQVSQRRAAERLAKQREKTDERHRTAAERWRQILELRRENKELKQALQGEQSRGEDILARVQSLVEVDHGDVESIRAELSELMPDPPA